jgi:pyruvate kinase
MRVKVVATLGPASMDYEKMKAMVGHGVRIFRLNFSHSDAGFFAPVVKMIRELENELDLPLTVMGDLCGPKIRIGEIENSPRQVFKGSVVRLGLPGENRGGTDQPFISLDMPELLKGLEPGMPVSLSDGMLQFRVVRTIAQDRLYELEAANSGILSSHKGIAFPGKFHPMPALTAKDRRDLHEGIDIGIDAVALSFVQSVEDVTDLKGEIARHGTWIPVVSKLERKNALDDLDAILAASDAIMVARGDLGLECPLSELPVIQKRILRACRHAQKGSIVATQMLLSMVKNPIPTRAESTDVANAILDGADCVMLSEETAIGDYPVEAVRFISEIAHNAEDYYLERLQVTDVVNIGIGGSDLGPPDGLRGTQGLRPPRPAGPFRLQRRRHPSGGGAQASRCPRRPSSSSPPRPSPPRRPWPTPTRPRTGFWKRPGSEFRRSRHFVAMSTNTDMVREFGIDPRTCSSSGTGSADATPCGRPSACPSPSISAWTVSRSCWRAPTSVDEHFRSAPLERNIPVLMALLGIWYANFFGAESHAILPYDQYLHRFPAYLQQADMESNGKRSPAGGSRGLRHRSGHLGRAGDQRPARLLSAHPPGHPAGPLPISSPRPSSLNPIGAPPILLSNFFAQTEALMQGKTAARSGRRWRRAGQGRTEIERLLPTRVFPGNRPTNSILFPKLTPRSWAP